MKMILTTKCQISGGEAEIVVFHKHCGKRCGEVREKYLGDWGKEEYLELSPINESCPQSYPHAFPRALQTLIPQSTGSTTITTLINIY